MFKKYNPFLLITVLLGICYLATYIPHKQVSYSTFKPSKMALEVSKERKQVHDEALAQIKADFAISDEKWDQFMGSCQYTIEQDDLLGSGSIVCDNNEPEIVSTTKKMLVEYGINPERVTVKVMRLGDTAAQAVQELSDDNKIIHRIELDINRLNKNSKAIQEALIRHEIMHLLNYDPLEGSYIITMLYQCGYSRQECTKAPAMIAYRHQRETRADLLASCDHPEVAQALQAYFEKFFTSMDQNNPALWTSHPTDITRHTQLAGLLTDMGIKNTTVV